MHQPLPFIGVRPSHYLFKHAYRGFVLRIDTDQGDRRCDWNVLVVLASSDTRGWVIEHKGIKPIGREHIAEAAIKVLGWKAPN